MLLSSVNDSLSLPLPVKATEECPQVRIKKQQKLYAKTENSKTGLKIDET